MSCAISESQPSTFSLPRLSKSRSGSFFRSHPNKASSIGEKPMVLEEYGKSSYSGIWNLFSNSKEAQANYLSEIQIVLEEEQLPSFIWTLHDFETVPTQVVGRKPWRKAPQKHFGLIDTDGEKKPAYHTIIKKEKGTTN